MTNDKLKAMNARCAAATRVPAHCKRCKWFTDLPDCLKEIERLQEKTKSFEYTRQAVSKIWKILGIATYEQAKCKSVDQLVQDKLDEIERLRGVLEDIANDEHDVGWYATYAQDEARKALEQA